MTRNTYATRSDIILTPASDANNLGKLWYVQIGQRCLAIIHADQMSDVTTVQNVIDNALNELNAATEAYLATI